MLADKKKACIDHRIVLHDGSIRYVQERTQLIIDNQNNSSRVIGTVQDITDRKLAKQTLKYSHDKFEPVLNNLDSVVYIVNLKSYEILFVNEYMKKEVGKDFTGKTCWQCIHEKQPDPCEFCTNDRLIDGDGNPTGLYICEFYHKKMNK